MLNCSSIVAAYVISITNTPVLMHCRRKQTCTCTAGTSSKYWHRLSLVESLSSVVLLQVLQTAHTWYFGVLKMLVVDSCQLSTSLYMISC